MQTIHLSHPLSKEQIVEDGIVLALGFFDGVHLGHQEVISRARQEADKRGLKLAVMTFNQHPKLVFGAKASDISYLTSTLLKAKIMEHLDVDILYVLDFTFDLASLDPQAFVDQYIVGLNAKVAVAGFDYSYGKKDLANMQTLPEHSQGRFEIIEVPKKEGGSEKISSTAVRLALKSGHTEKANEYLGYHFTMDGTVVHGEKRGRELGYPTANLSISSDMVLPKVGVYVVSIKVKDQWYWGMASIGYNITFGDHDFVTVEVNILDFNQMIYGESVLVSWHHYLRPEEKYDSISALVNQLARDEEATRAYAADHEITDCLIGEVD